MRGAENGKPGARQAAYRGRPGSKAECNAFFSDQEADLLNYTVEGIAA